jgi:DNA-binding transcriptional LysR family regulator|uniref:LysR family transcriptional regulator n=1 Tax=Mesosutterella multiformis TaxID=2259133 RepID=UPI0040263E67
MRHYSLTDIELFLAVSDEENLTRGASRVGLSPSSASIRLKNIEEALQVKLFIRRKNGLELTRAGRVAAQEARRVVKDLDALEASLSPFAQMEKGILRITANYGASVDFLPDDISEYLVENPLARIVLEQKSSLEVIKTVAEGRADLGVGAYEGDYPGVVFRPYREDRLVLAVPAGHELAGRKELAFSESLAYPFVSLTDESAMQRFIFEHAREEGSPITPKVQVDNQRLLMKLVSKKVGIAVLSTRGASGNFWPGVRFVRLTNRWAERHLRIALSRSAELRGPGADRFVAFLEKRRDKAASGSAAS